MKLYTFGCKVNQAESNDIESRLNNFNTQDLVVINSCAVTEKAEKKCRQLINRLLRKYPHNKIVLTGCYLQKDHEDLKHKYKDIIFIKDKSNITKILNLKKQSNICKAFINGTKSPKSPKSSRVFIKIQDGCKSFCSYCIVPYVRPVVQSKPLAKIEKEIKNAIDLGHKEIVFTGIKIGDYNNKENWNIAQLLGYVCDKYPINRIRISSIEPTQITDELIDIFSKYKKICPHLHIPIQSADDTVLYRMNRKYDVKFLKDLISKLRKKIKNLRITSDIIIGFPGETEQNFDNTINFLRDQKIDGLHIFPFSPRPNTKAYDMKDKVDVKIINKRKAIMKSLDKDLKERSSKKYVGKKMNVLIERKNKQGLFEGLTDNYIRVYVKSNKDLSNQIINYTI